MQIYQIINVVTNKSYVGKSSNYKLRFTKHKNNALRKVNRRLYDSMNYHGIDNFLLVLLEDLGDCDKEYANERERYWIYKLNTLNPNGYNMTVGGDGGNTLTEWSMEEKLALWKKQGQSRKGYKHSEKTKKTISQSKLGTHLSNDHKASISKTLKEKYNNGELIINLPKVLCAENHNNWVDIDIDNVVERIKCGFTLKSIAELYGVSTVTVGSRLKQYIGQTFIELRRFYNVRGRFSSPKID